MISLTDEQTDAIVIAFLTGRGQPATLDEICTVIGLCLRNEVVDVLRQGLIDGELVCDLRDGQLFYMNAKPKATEQLEDKAVKLLADQDQPLKPKRGRPPKAKPDLKALEEQLDDLVRQAESRKPGPMREQLELQAAEIRDKIAKLECTTSVPSSSSPPIASSGS